MQKQRKVQRPRPKARFNRMPHPRLNTDQFLYAFNNQNLRIPYHHEIQQLKSQVQADKRPTSIEDARRLQRLLTHASNVQMGVQEYNVRVARRQEKEAEREKEQEKKRTSMRVKAQNPIDTSPSFSDITASRSSSPSPSPDQSSHKQSFFSHFFTRGGLLNLFDFSRSSQQSVNNSRNINNSNPYNTNMRHFHFTLPMNLHNIKNINQNSPISPMIQHASPSFGSLTDPYQPPIRPNLHQEEKSH